ncbi:MAG: hypothetical protein ABIO02_02375 [Patescibacteria group bacterium]
MSIKIGSKASIPNPALKPFDVLIGEWKTTGSHPLVPDTVLHGRAHFEWLDNGAFLVMRSEIDEPNFPAGIAIFGSDDVANKMFILYFDERGISRKYDVTFEGNTLTWWRDDPTFSQRMNITVEEDGNKLIAKGEMSQEGAPWENDIELTYTRV